MKNIPPALLAHIQGPLLTLATCWRAVLFTGQIVTATSHDQDLIINGEYYPAFSGYTPSAIDSMSELNPDNMEITAFLAHPGIVEEDLHSGKWDYAKIQIFEVNYEDLSMGMHILRTGTMGEIKAGREQVTIEVRGMMQAYTRTLGRVSTAECQAELGDSQCKIDFAGTNRTAGYRNSGVVQAIEGNRVIHDTYRTEPTNWYSGGRITFTSGLNNNLSMEMVYGEPGRVILAFAMPYTVAVGDTYHIFVGCLKRFNEDCVAKFNNGINFRGFPHLPGQVIYRVGGLPL